MTFKNDFKESKNRKVSVIFLRFSFKFSFPFVSKKLFTPTAKALSLDKYKLFVYFPLSSMKRKEESNNENQEPLKNFPFHSCYERTDTHILCIEIFIVPFEIGGRLKVLLRGFKPSPSYKYTSC